MSYATRTSASAAMAYNYHAIFGDVCSTRFQKLARFLFTSSWILSVVIALPSSCSWWNTLLPFRGLVLAFGFFLLTCLRKNNLHVDFLGYKTLANQVIGQLANKKFVLALVIYSVSSLIFFSSIHSQLEGLPLMAIPMRHQYPPLNDQFVFFYFFSIYAAVVYSLQHSIFDKDRLVITYGNFHAHPKNAILSKIPSVVSSAVVLTLLSLVSAPFVYLTIRSYIYDVLMMSLGLVYSVNQTYPASGITIGLLLKLLIVSLLLFLSWELVNTAFNAYLSIGCLHRGHTLSGMSSDPLGTLLTGLKSEKLFTKMTAFQELAYIAKIEDPEGRQAIYNRNNKREFIWGEILQECEKVIKANNININKALIQDIVSEPESNIHKVDPREHHIFGREYYGPERRASDIFVTPAPLDEQSFLDHGIVTLIIANLKQTALLAKQYYSLFITSGLGIPFRYSVRREAERICPVPVTVGNAIIAISLIITHAYTEDTKGTVSSTITDIMDILEKSVSSCGHFVQSPPADLVDRDEDSLITMLHDLSMNAFFEVTIKYSDVLKDVALPTDVLRLVNWTLEAASREEEEE